MRKSIAAALSATALALGGLAVTATPAAADVNDCGFSFSSQSYRNCGPGGQSINMFVVDSILGTSGWIGTCIPGNTTRAPLVFSDLVVNVVENGSC